MPLTTVSTAVRRWRPAARTDPTNTSSRLEFWKEEQAYFLDCSTGMLTATVPACRGAGGFWGMYKADVTKALRGFITQNPKDAFGQPLEMPSKPNYVMTTTPFHYLGKLNQISWPAECISIVETQTGIQFLFVIPFNATKYKQGTQEQSEMRLFTAKQINPVMRRKQL